MVLTCFRSLKPNVSAFWPVVTMFCHVIFSMGPYRTTSSGLSKKIVVLLNMNVVCLGVFRLTGRKTKHNIMALSPRRADSWFFLLNFRY